MAKQWFPLNLSRMRLIQRLVPVYELFKPVEFGWGFSSGARTQSSSEGRIKLNIPFLDGCWLIISSEMCDGWFSAWSAAAKFSSDRSALKLVVRLVVNYLLTGVLLSFVVESYLNLLSALLKCHCLFSIPWCFKKLRKFFKIICYQAQQR